MPPLDVSSSCRHCLLLIVSILALLLSSEEQGTALIAQHAQTISLMAFNQLQLWKPFMSHLRWVPVYNQAEVEQHWSKWGWELRAT